MLHKAAAFIIFGGMKMKNEEQEQDEGHLFIDQDGTPRYGGVLPPARIKDIDGVDPEVLKGLCGIDSSEDLPEDMNIEEFMKKYDRNPEEGIKDVMAIGYRDGKAILMVPTTGYQARFEEQEDGTHKLIVTRPQGFAGCAISYVEVDLSGYESVDDVVADDNLVDEPKVEVPKEVEDMIKQYNAEKVKLDLEHQASEDQKYREAISRANDIARQGIEERAEYEQRNQKQGWKASEQGERFRYQRQLADIVQGSPISN